LAYKRILVPLDGSPLSEEALPHAKSLAQSLGAELVLLRVIDNPITEFVFPDLAENTIQKIEAKSENYMKALHTSLEGEGFCVSYLVCREPAVPRVVSQETTLAVGHNYRAGRPSLTHPGNCDLPSIY